MARTVDESAHEQRRERFMDALERLLVSKGFQDTTIADVLAEAGASKGAFYHYFDSKAALLEGLLQRFTDRAVAVVESVVASPADAPEKLHAFGEVLAEWKASHREVLLAAARAWYGDGNSLPREKLRRGGRERIAGLLSDVIRQGTREGVFGDVEPVVTGRLVMVVLQDLQESLADWVLGQPPDEAELAVIHRRIAEYHRCLERLLGAAPDSVTIVEPRRFDEWFQN